MKDAGTVLGLLSIIATIVGISWAVIDLLASGEVSSVALTLLITGCVSGMGYTFLSRSLD